MKQNRLLLFSLLLMCLSLIACRKDSTNNDHLSVHSLSNSWKKSPKVYLIDAARDTQIVAEKGTVITLPAGSFLSEDGSPISSGTVHLELIELYGLSDYIFQKNTAITSDNRLFISGGQVMLKATLGDAQPLSSTGYHLAFKQDGSKLDIELPMYYFYAAPPSEDGWIRWDASTAAGETLPQNDSFEGLVPDTVKDFYYVFESLNRFDWINCDQFVVGTGTKDLRAKVLVEGFNLTNAEVMFLFPELNSLVPATSYLDDEGVFAALGVEVPEGTEVQVLMFGYLDGVLYYTLSAASAYTEDFMIACTPVSGSEEGLTSLINTVD